MSGRLFTGRGLSIAILGAALGCAWTGAASAQQIAPSLVTPQTLRPTTGPAGTILLPRAAGLAAPAGAENLSLTLGGVSVEGGFPELKGPTDAIAARLTGRRATLAEIYTAANAIEQAYAAVGYVLVRVVVPPQKLVPGGTLRLVVIDGFIEGVDVKGTPERERPLIAARMASLIGKRHVTLAEIERRLLLVSDIPGLVLRSTLAQGKNPGAAQLVLEATQNYVTGTIGVDNRLPKSLGIWELNSSLALNSAFGFGEQAYISATSGYQLGRTFDGDSPLRILGGGVVLPIGTDGFTLNPEYTNSVTREAAAPGAPATQGLFERFALHAAYPVIRTRADTLTIQATYEWDEEHLTPLGFNTDLYRDRYQAIRLQGSDQMTLSWGAAAQATAVFSQGVGGRGEATAIATGIPLSQQGASPTFSKFNFDLRYQQPLPEAFQLSLVGRAQTSFNEPLMLAEQFSLDGMDAVSGFASGELPVDEGATARAELSWPFALPVAPAAVTVSPYIFGAGGWGTIVDPTALQTRILDASSFGLGLHVGGGAADPTYGGTLTVEFARALSDLPGEQRGYRGNLILAVRF